MKKLSGGVRTALAQYRELAAFSQFASDLDEITKAQLARGQRITELIKQKQYSPLSVAQQSLSIFAADKGHMDDVEVEKIGSFEEALHGFFSSEKPELEKAINETGDWNDDIEKKFTEVVEQFKKTQTF
jgi:F-type H+-transporting ATPase subunit alpha